MLTAVQVGEDDATRWLIGRVPGSLGATAHAYQREQLLPAAASEPVEPVDPEHVREVYLALRDHSDGVLVEGPSGLLAPLGEGLTTADIAQALGLPLVDRLPPGRRHRQPRRAHARGRARAQPRGARADRERRKRRPGTRGAREPLELARLAPILADRPGRDDQLALGLAARARQERPGSPAVARRIGEREPDARRHARRQPEAEAVEPRAAAACARRRRAHPPARAPSRPPTGARPGTPLRAARAQAHEARRRRRAGRAGTTRSSICSPDGRPRPQHERVGAVGQRRELPGGQA